MQVILRLFYVLVYQFIFYKALDRSDRKTICIYIRTCSSSYVKFLIIQPHRPLTTSSTHTQSHTHTQAQHTRNLTPTHTNCSLHCCLQSPNIDAALSTVHVSVTESRTTNSRENFCVTQPSLSHLIQNYLNTSNQIIILFQIKKIISIHSITLKHGPEVS